MDFSMLEPYCYAYQIPDCYRLAVSDRRAFHIEVEVDFVHLAAPPGVTSSDRLMLEVSREESYEFSFPVDQLSRDATGEQNVRYMLTEAGVMYTPHHEFMVQMVLSRAASIAGDERNREAEVLLMWVYISCADPWIHRELMMSEEDEDEGLATSYDEGEDMDTSEDNDEEEAAMIGQWLAGLMEVEVTERSVDCAICCEEIIAGSTASSMPCCHVYHRGCIAKWLKNSRTCPLCRFELPSTCYY